MTFTSSFSQGMHVPELGLSSGPVHAYTVEPRCNQGPRAWNNMFAITRFRYMEVLFHIFYYYWGQENLSLYRGLCYIEVR